MSDLKAALEAWGSDQQPQKRKRGGKKQRERAEEHAKRQKEAPVAAAPVAALAAPAVAPVAAAPVVPAVAPAAGQDLKSALEAWGGDQEPAKRKRGGKKQRERAEEHAKQAAAAAPTAAAAPVAAPTAAAPTAAAPVAAAPATATKSARVCEHFSRGQCTRGDKCRFSHVAGASSEGTKKRARPGAQARHKAQDWAANNGKRESDRGDNVRDVECRGHALPCVRRVVEKAGAKNYGRAFLSCRYWRDKGGCGHFAWVDDGGVGVR